MHNPLNPGACFPINFDDYTVYQSKICKEKADLMDLNAGKIEHISKIMYIQSCKMNHLSINLHMTLPIKRYAMHLYISNEVHFNCNHFFTHAFLLLSALVVASYDST